MGGEMTNFTLYNEAQGWYTVEGTMPELTVCDLQTEIKKVKSVIVPFQTVNWTDANNL